MHCTWTDRGRASAEQARAAAVTQAAASVEAAERGARNARYAQAIRP